MKTGRWIGIVAFVVLFCSGSLWAEDVLKFGVAPVEAPKVMFQQFTPLAQYLSKELGVKVELVIGKDYPSTADLLGENKVQVAWMTPSIYPLCQKQNPTMGIEPIARFLTEGKGATKTGIIVPAGSDIKSLADLKGKKFAVVDPNAASGYLVPLSMLKEAGIDEKDLGEIKFLGSHSNVATAIKMKQFDAGGLKLSVAEKFEKEGSVKILASSKEMPEHPVCVNKNLPAEMKTKLTAALLKLKLDKDNKDAPANAILTAINPKYTGCEAAKAEDYDPMRDVIQKLFGDKFYEKKKAESK